MDDHPPQRRMTEVELAGATSVSRTWLSSSIWNSAEPSGKLKIEEKFHLRWRADL